MIFETHAHYDDDRFEEDRDALLRCLPQEGVGVVINSGASVESTRDTIRLAGEYDHVYAAVGVHPSEIEELDETFMEWMEEQTSWEKTVAIGEIGLDYYYDDNPPSVQKAAFLRQMELAAETGLPVVIHDRDAHGDTLDIVRRVPTVKGVFHCYSGSAEMAKEVVKLGYYVGFTGVITFKNARKAVEALQSVPLDRILMETDCPYMAPEPHRGKRCDSRLLPCTVQRAAELCGISAEEMAEITEQNAKRLFGIA